MSKPKKLLRPQEAQARLACGHSKFYADYVATVRLRLYELGPRSVGVLEDELETLIDSLPERTAEVRMRRRPRRAGFRRLVAAGGCDPHNIRDVKIKAAAKRA